MTAIIRRGLAGEAVAETVTVHHRMWLITTSPQRSADGDVTGVLALLTFADQVEIRSALVEREFDVTKFGALVDSSADFISMADRTTGRLTYLNPAGADLVGLPPDTDIEHLTVSDFLPPDRADLGPLIRTAVAATGRWSGESELHNFRTGERIPVSVNVFAVPGPEGTDEALATVQRDLRDRIENETAMAQRMLEQRLAADFARQALTLPLPELLQEAVDLIAVRFTDMTCAVLRPGVAGDLLQVVASSVPGRASAVLRRHPGTFAARAMDENLIQVSDDLLHDDRYTNKVNASAFDIRGTIACPIPGEDAAWGLIGPVAPQPVTWTEDDVAFVESVAATVGAAVRRHDLETQLAHQALHDPLTGLPNRALATDRIEHALRRSELADSRLAILLLDLDDFKTVNDSLGHGSGDALLAELATRFERAVRPGDTVARLGGDEFVVVCEEVESLEAVAYVAESLLNACATGVLVEGRELQVTASIGVATALRGDGTPATLLSHADIAMYRSKRDRPGTYRIFDEAMQGDVVGRLNLAGELRAAVRADALDVAYQPIVDLATGRVVAMEALARWTSRSGEVVPPDVFIPLAEETGLIAEVGQAVLRAAARQALTWQRHGEVAVRVNASAHELRHPQYVDRVLATLAGVGLAADLLGVEITESMLVAEDQASQHSLTRLRAAGVTLLIDDFGTGYSSLSYLQRFPVVDVLKIDRSFLAEDLHGKAVVEAIVALGRAFGLRVCAEGVETPDQHRLVAELGCHFAQGYLLSRPVRAEETDALLAGWRPVLAPGT